MGESSSKSATNRPPSAHSNTDAITSRNSEPILQRQSLDNHSLKNHKPRKKTIKNERADFQLHRAASAGNFEVVSHLIKKGATVNLRNPENFTPFHLALLKGYKECAQILIKAGGELDTPFPRNPGVTLDYSIRDNSGLFVWTIENFSSITDTKIASEIFQIGGCRWKLVAYPRGSKNDDHFSIYVEIVDHKKLLTGSSYIANFSFSILNQLTKQKQITREVFAYRFNKNHTDLGFPRFVRRNILTDKKSGCLVGDKLTIEFSLQMIHNTLYARECDTTSFSWKLINVSSLNSRVTSTPFSLKDCKWIITLYPKGKSGGTYLSIYLKVADSSSLPPSWFYVVNFKFSLINQRNGTKFSRQVEGKRFADKVEDWGFPQFMKLSVLYDPKEGFLVDDSLIVEVQMEIIDCHCNDRNPPLDSSRLTNVTFTPLHWAVYKRRLDYVQDLLTAGANPNTFDHRGRTPLDWSVYLGEYEIAKALIESSANVNCTDCEGYTPLHKAVLNGYHNIVKLLVNNGADVNFRCLNGLTNSPHNRVTSLDNTTIDNLERETDRFTSQQPHNKLTTHSPFDSLSNTLTSTTTTNTSTHTNSNNSENRFDVFDDENATNETDVDIPQLRRHSFNEEYGPLKIATRDSTLTTKFATESNDTQVETRQSGTQLQTLSSVHTPSITSFRSPSKRTMLSVTETNPQICVTPLQLAFILNQTDCVYTLLTEHKAEVNVRDVFGRTPLHYAAFKGDVETVQLLLQLGAQINCQDDEGFTPLHKALWTAKFECVEILVTHGADLNAKTITKNWTPLQLAVILNELPIVRLLLNSNECSHSRSKANEHSTDSDSSKTPTSNCSSKLLSNHNNNNNNQNVLLSDIQSTQVASPSASRSSVEHNNAYNHFVNCTDIRQNTPLHEATANGHLEMMALLIKNGANVSYMNIDGITPLSLAIRNSDIKAIVYLLENGAALTNATKELLNFLSKIVSTLQSEEVVIPPSTLSTDMRFLLNNEKYKDITFIVEGKHVYAWRGILCARSEFFRAMFFSPLKESAQELLEVPHVSYSTFLRVLEYLYTDTILDCSTMSIEEALQLLSAANRYILERLKRIVERYLLNFINLDNVAVLFQAADLYEAHYLRSECLKFIAMNSQHILDIEDIIPSENFRHILIRFFKKTQKPETMYNIQ